MKLGACVIACNEAWTIRAVLEPLIDCCDHVVCCVSNQLYPARGGHVLPDDGTQRIAIDTGATVLTSEKPFPYQYEHRQYGMDYLQLVQSCDMALMLDADEVFLRDQLQAIRQLFERRPRVHKWVTRMWDYYKLPCWRVTNPRQHMAPIALNLHSCWCGDSDVPIRNIVTRPGLKDVECGEFPPGLWPRHYTWVRSNEGMREKLLKSEDRGTLRSTWERSGWHNWTPGSQNFWPYFGDNWAGEYPAVEHEVVPDEIRAALDVPGEW